MKTNLIWTALPTGATSNATGGITLTISVYVSPRLDPEGPTLPLGDFDLGTNDNYTAWVQNLIMGFEFGPPAAPTVVTGTLVNAGDGALDPTLWPQIFPTTTPVRGYRYDSLSAKRLFSYPVAEIVGYLDELYGNLAVQNPTDFPGLGSQSPTLDGFIRTLGRIRRALPGLEQTTNGNPSDDAILNALGVAGDAQTQARALAFYRAYRFYNRRAVVGPAPENRQPPAIPDIDFHEMIALMGDYPVLLRKLGLVLDYEVSANSVFPPASFVRAMPASAAGGAIAGTRPLTAYDLDFNTPTFFATPLNGSDLNRGMLDLSDAARFPVTQVDVDGSALKTIELASNLTQLVERAPAQQNSQQSVASLRSAGFAVSRSDRATRLASSFPDQDALNTALESGDPTAVEATPLFADDITRGYRLDVQQGNVWRSLTARVGNYTVGPNNNQLAIGPVQDEGYVKGESLSGEADVPDDLYLHEHVFSWDGWSLAARRPGRDISFEKDQGDPRFQEPRVQREPNDPLAGFDVSTDFRAAPGTLPRLRFGETYRFRARAVDLAGNSLPLSTPSSASFATEAISYLRYEPVQQPILVYRGIVTEGEAIEHLVIRSNRGQSVSSYVADPQVAVYDYPTTCERHVAAPKVTQAMAEAHGAFDNVWTSEDQASHQTSYLIALKEAGTFQDREVFDPGMGQYVQVQNIELVSTATTPDDKVDVWPAQRGDSLATGQYVMHTGESVVLPYLPDPIAKGIALEDRAGGVMYTRDYVGSWPDAEPFRLVVREGSEVDVEPRIEVAGDTLDVFLPKATIFELRYSSCLDASDLALFAHFPKLAGNTAALTAARECRHWMFTPQRNITLVHAVQRPLEDPEADLQQDDTREQGQTWVTLLGDLLCHGRSSGQVDLRAHWVDPIDLLSDDAPSTSRHEAQLLSLLPEYGQDSLQLGTSHQQDFGDTKHRNVVYQAIATTRYREYFPPEIYKDTNNITAVEAVAEPGTLETPAPVFTKQSVSILSTARPDVPRVLYAIPTFAWDSNGDGSRKTRRGNGLRVYLERPWFSSGEDELLGVTLLPPNGVEATSGRFVSEWGSDPLRKNLAPQNRLAKGHFKNEAATGTNLSLPDIPSATVDVVGFSVEFEPERQLWFADIELDGGDAYFPFLRLVLCRFQPESLDGLELSGIVATEWNQLTPDRTATVSRTNASTVRVALSGTTGDNIEGNQNVLEPASPDDFKAPPGQSGGFNLATPDLMLEPARGEHHQVIARLQRKTGDSDLDWKDSGTPVVLSSYRKDAEPEVAVWSGSLPLSAGAQGGGDDYRIAIEEYEVYLSDPDVAQNPATDPTVKALEGSEPVASRLIFVAHFGVPS